MTIPGMNLYTLAEYDSLTAGAAKVHPRIIHTMQDASPLLDQIPFAPCNNGRSNMTKVIDAYPEGQLRGFNEGVDSEKSAAHIQEDPTCMVSTYSAIDAEILKQNNFSAEFRAMQDATFHRGLAHSMATRVFQGNRKKDPRGINGLQARYNKISGALEDCIIDAGGTSGSNNLCDIWVCNWGLDKVHGIFPEGGTAGLTVIDRGEQDIYDGNSKRYRGFVTDYYWNFGLAVEDPTQVIRIANIDNAKLKADPTDKDFDLVRLITEAIERLPDGPGPQCAIYMNQTARFALRMQILAKSNVQLTYDTVAGRKVLVHDGVPVHKVPVEVLGLYSTAVA